MQGKHKKMWSAASLAAVAALLTMSLPVSAAADEYDPPSRVARLKYIQGAVSFQPAGEPDWVSAVANRPMTTGDKLWSDNGARAELRIGSATMRLAGNTGFSFLNLDDRTVQLQLTQGTLDIRVQRLRRGEIFEVDTPNQAFSILRPGQYRIQASEDGNSTYVTVRNGEGEATGGGQTYSVHSGEEGTFTGSDYLEANVVRARGNDEFDNWGDTRDRRDNGSRSARYVSPDVVGYEDLDDNGSWRNDPTYGNVWAPRVSRDWAPYHDGHWSWISPWGWTWVDDAPWGYAPFHYGRWISARGDWCWVPGPVAVEPVYAPALVAFIGGSNFGVSVSVGGGGYGGGGGNVGWFPLGPSEVYVPGYNTSRGYVDRVNVSNTTVSNTTITNVYNNQVTNINNTTNNTNVNNANVTYVNKTVAGAVTAVPQAAFVSAQPIARSAVAVNAQQIAAAPVNARAVAAAAPVRSSVLGSSASSANHVAQPPAAIANRAVVAKATPPPPPVPFAKQQQALAAHPGQPLAAREVQALRPAAMATAQPLVKQAPAGKAAVPNTNRPEPQAVAARPGAPVNVPANRPAPANMPPANGAANAPANSNQPARADRPPPAQPNTPAAMPSRTAEANPAVRGNIPATNSPANRPANMPPANGSANASGNSNQPMRADRAPTAVQNNSRAMPSPAADPRLKDPRIDAYRGRPNPQPGPPQAAAKPQETQVRPTVAREDRPPLAPAQVRPIAQAENPANRNPRPLPQAATPVRAPSPPAPGPTPRAAQPPTRPNDPPAASAYKVNKTPIDTNAASQRGQASRSQPVQPPVKPLPRAANQPQDRPQHPSPEQQQ